jgi:hypothetical protein
MRKILLAGLTAGALTLATFMPAAAFVPAQSGIADAATIIDDTVAVKQKAKWKKHAKHRPYGWSRGRKVGWRGAGMPPGQRKKYRR